MVFLTHARFAYTRRIGRPKSGPDRYWRKKIILDQAKHFYGRHSSCFRLAVRAVHRSWIYMNRARKVNRRNLGRLWIVRINAASKEHGLRYSSFMGGLVKTGVALDRKIISQLAIYEPKTFQCLTELAKKKVQEGYLAALSRQPDGIVTKFSTQEDLLQEGIRKLRLEASKDKITSEAR